MYRGNGNGVIEHRASAVGRWRLARRCWFRRRRLAWRFEDDGSLAGTFRLPPLAGAVLLQALRAAGNPDHPGPGPGHDHDHEGDADRAHHRDEHRDGDDGVSA